jgi:LuxR family maltose regulon positive regulatory protein
LNEIEGYSGCFVVVLDDYHYITSPLIHTCLNFLVDYQPPNMHVVIVSREDPPLPLHRMRGRGQVLEIRQESIRFRQEETARFLMNVLGQQLSGENIAGIQHRTEGWVTGIQLLALSLQQHQDPNTFIQSFTGSDSFVLDYLFEEIFHQQSAEVQEFLLKTAVLENLSADLCKAVSGNPLSAEILHDLEQANLFIIPVDQTQAWYRYHRLFLELLKHRLRIHPGFSLPDLHLHASQWYQSEGYTDNAVLHALAGEHWERAIELMENASDEMLKRGEISTMLEWLKHLPVELVLSRPEYCLLQAWPLLLFGQANEADLYLQTAEEKSADTPEMMGNVAAAQAFQARTIGDGPRMVERSELALSLLPEADLSARAIVALNLGLAYWHNGEMDRTDRILNEALNAARQTSNKYAEVTAMLFLGRVYAVRGLLRQAANFLEGIVSIPVRMPIVGLAHLDLSALHYEWNDLQSASQHLEVGIEMIGPRDNFEFQAAGFMQKARLLAAIGNEQGALDTLVEGNQLMAENLVPASSQVRMAACNVEIGIALGDIAQAELWAEKVPAEPDTFPFYRNLYLTPIRLKLALGDLQEARVLLEQAAQQAEQAGWQYGLVVLWVMQAIAAPDLDAAVEFLQKALEFGHAQRFIRSFVDAGEKLVPILKEAARRGLHPDYIGEILAAFDDGESSVLPEGVEPLSERELEVLHLLAAGLSNRDISEQLVVSVSTVKSHVHHISSKLGAVNRTEAVSLAREYGLL